ncbi:sodium/glutamate symporter [Methylophaga marina]|uniref:sodium/glutamate symporter n=1 Tax=Methylophaga marina TaxID=45495 RepID=UPI003305702B
MIGDWVRPNGHGRLWNWPSMQPGLALISDISLGLFLTMALMGLRLWELQPVLGFITVAMLVQTFLVIAFVLLVVFRAMGKDYQAAVMFRLRRNRVRVHCHRNRQHDGGHSGAWRCTGGVHRGAVGMWVGHRYCERTDNQPDGRLGKNRGRGSHRPRFTS